MKLRSKILTALAVSTIGVTPLALAGGAIAHPGRADTHTPNAHAYGKFCQGQPKKHVKGEKGTLFSECVTAMAHLAKGTTTSPSKACASLAKTHVKGMKGTPYSECVAAGAKLLAAEKH